MTETATATVKHRTDYPPKWEYHTLENPDTALLKYVHPKLATSVDKNVKELLKLARDIDEVDKYYRYEPENFGLQTTTFALGPWGARRGGEDKWYFKTCTVKPYVVSRG
ncbi:hypothetical protein HK104_002254, partial [Borealophlyctis nickersoniae]